MNESHSQLDFQKDQNVPHQETHISELLKELQIVQQESGQELATEIYNKMKYRQDPVYHLFVSQKRQFISSMWKLLHNNFQNQSPLVEELMMQKIEQKNLMVIHDLEDEKIMIENYRLKPFNFDDQQKERKVEMLRVQSSMLQNKIHNLNQGLEEIKSHENQQHANSSRFKYEIQDSKIKQYEEFLKKQKKQKQDRHKYINDQRKKEEQSRQQKQQNAKQNQQKLMKERKEQLIKKLKQQEKKREHQKNERQQRVKQYKYISKSLASQPPLFKRLQKSFLNRYQSQQNKRKQQMKSERHSMSFHPGLDQLEEHERKYQQMKLQRERQRKDKSEEIERMMELQQEQMQSKFKSNNHQVRTHYIDEKEEEKKLAKEKREKAKRYIEETVKEHYLPQIDEEKRKQILTLIEDFGKKKVKKIRNKNGEIEYEQVKPSDHRMLGLQYLQKTKEIAAKMRSRRKASEHLIPNETQKTKVVDYLAQKRKKKSTSHSNRKNLGFVNRKELSFDQKFKIVELESQKLQELAKQKQMKLKHGKFGTSQQILYCKEEIDQHYIDIINMKLKLVNYKEE